MGWPQSLFLEGPRISDWSPQPHVQSSWSFLRRMLDLLHSHSNQTHMKVTIPIRLNREFRADLAWWSTFIERWNSVSFRPTSKTNFYYRSFRYLQSVGLRRMVGPPLVSDPVVGSNKRIAIRNKRTSSSSHRLCNMGTSMVKAPSHMVLWQPSSDGLCLIQDQQTPDNNAPTPELGVRRGSIRLPLTPRIHWHTC